MAAIDPDAEPEYEDDAAAGKPPRSTLKIVRVPADMDMDDEDDEDYEDVDSEDDSDDEEINGGPSDKAKAKQRQAAALMDLDGEEDDDEEDDTDRGDFKAALSQLIKGKGPATGDEDEDDDDEEGLELEEIVVCTLDTEKVGALIYRLLILDSADSSRHTNNRLTSPLPMTSASCSRSTVHIPST
jgi:FK506-binding nuclear protein